MQDEAREDKITFLEVLCAPRLSAVRKEAGGGTPAGRHGEFDENALATDRTADALTRLSPLLFPFSFSFSFSLSLSPGGCRSAEG